ncbi:hypothetical protein PaG_04273 [Moesziomyces aphidis]|uniref:Uncharacterized protein n=1 Tax=Moesziomyces aphidis TaxID=84754 RepID=W3VJ27_MOEAP|nr:hypothetical protein PaG_04273 [Moesziomyces aphidis]
MRSAFAKPGGAEAAAVTATRLEMRITISRLKGVNAQIPALHRLPKPPLGPRRRAHAARASPQTSAAVVRTLGIPQRQAWIIIIVVLLHAWSSLLAATRLRSGLGWPNGFCKAAELLLPSALATMDRLAATFTRLNRDLASFLFFGVHSSLRHGILQLLAVHWPANPASQLQQTSASSRSPTLPAHSAALPSRRPAQTAWSRHSLCFEPCRRLDAVARKSSIDALHPTTTPLDLRAFRFIYTTSSSASRHVVVIPAANPVYSAHLNRAS